VLIFCLILF